MRTRIATRWNAHNIICLIAVLASAGCMVIEKSWIFFLTAAIATLSMIREVVPDE